MVVSCCFNFHLFGLPLSAPLSAIGYWGCVFLNGSEYRTSWHADSLRDGAKVGFLVTNAGDILLFVDGEAVVHIERAPADFSKTANYIL